MKALFGERSAMNQTDAFEFKCAGHCRGRLDRPGHGQCTEAMEGVKSITLFVDANPNPLSARFNFDARRDARVQDPHQDGRELGCARGRRDRGRDCTNQTRNVKVTLGGCGG
jgi:sulfur-oxidizing protein SoxY